MAEDPDATVKRVEQNAVGSAFDINGLDGGERF